MCPKLREIFNFLNEVNAKMSQFEIKSLSLEMILPVAFDLGSIYMTVFYLENAKNVVKEICVYTTTV